MEIEVITAEGLERPLTDLDLTPSGDWIGVSTGVTCTFVSSALGTFEAPSRCRFPIIRAIDDDRLLLVDRRLGRRAVHNAWILDRAGKLLEALCFGDAVADALVFDERLAVTYFDQAYGDSRGFDGVALFTPSGDLVASYNRLDQPRPDRHRRRRRRRG